MKSRLIPSTLSQVRNSERIRIPVKKSARHNFRNLIPLFTFWFVALGHRDCFRFVVERVDETQSLAAHLMGFVLNKRCFTARPQGPKVVFVVVVEGWVVGNFAAK